MKITVNKKKTLLLLLSILFFILLCLGYFLLKGFPLNWNLYKSEKYIEMDSYCDRSSNDSGMSFKCKGFLKWIDYGIENNVCLGISVLTKENTLEDLEFCELKSSIDTSNPVFSNEKLVPINFDIVYDYEIPFTYKFKKIELNLMDDSDTLEILSDLYDNDIQLFNVRMEAGEEIDKNKYYYSITDSIIQGTDLGFLTFQNATINEIYANGDLTIMDISLDIKGESKKIEVKTKRFKYITDPGNLEAIFIDSKNFLEIQTGTNVNLMFIYFPKGGNFSEQNITEYCEGLDLEYFSICDYSNPLGYSNSMMDIDEYIMEILSSEERIDVNKLILNFVIKDV